MDQMKTGIYLSALISFFVSIQSCTSDYTQKLGNGYFYRFEGSDLRDIHCEKADGGEVPADILMYVFNCDFIIAKQRPKLPQDPLYKRNYSYKNGDNELYYWIIIKKTDSVLGPLDFKEFYESASELNLPKSMISKLEPNK